MAVNNGSLDDLEVLEKGWSSKILPCNERKKEFAHEFNVQTRGDGQKKYDAYKNGKTRYATDKGLENLCNDISKVPAGTGMIVNEEVTVSLNLPDGGLGVDLRLEDDGKSIKMSGSFGDVHRCKDNKTGLDLVVKKMKREKFHPTEASIPRHKHVCEVFGLIVVNVSTVTLLLSYAGETLDKYLRHTELLEQQIHDLSIQGLEGLIHLCKFGVKHMDIKPNNICVKVDTGGQLKLVFIDFGTARFSYEDMPTCGFTAFYFSPELCRHYLRHKIDVSLLNGKIDVYAFGLVILFMCSGKHVMKELAIQSLVNSNSQDKQLKKIKNEYYVMICRNRKLGHEAVKQFGIGILETLLYKMMEYSPEERSSSEEALKMAKEIHSEVSHGMVPSYNGGANFKDKPPETRGCGTLHNGAQTYGDKSKKHKIVGGEPDLGSLSSAGIVPEEKRSKLAEPEINGNVPVNQVAGGKVSRDLERLPELPSLCNRENSTLVSSCDSGSGEGNLPYFSKLLSSE